MTITLHKNDLPDGLDFGDSVAVDTETLGLSLTRDPLCLVQLSAGDGNAHLVQMDRSSHKCNEILGARLNTIHNLYYYQELMSNIRQSIEGNHFDDFVAGFYEAYGINKKTNRR